MRLALVLLLSLVGCGGGDKPNVGTVTGAGTPYVVPFAGWERSDSEGKK